MFTKIKVKKYLNSNEDWKLYDDVLHFYASNHMKEVFKFWGLSNIYISVQWENNVPIALNADAKYHSELFCITFNKDVVSYAYGHENKTETHFNYSDFDTINDLFTKLREQLENITEASMS